VRYPSECRIRLMGRAAFHKGKPHELTVPISYGG
jgi:hypothetical protein